MKPFDLGTLVYIIGAISFLFGILMLIFYRINPDINGPIFWSLGSFCVVISSLTFTMEHLLNGYVAFVISAIFAIGGIMLYWSGIRAFKGLPVKYRVVIGVVLLQLILSTLFYSILPMPNARMSTYSLISIVASLISARELKKPVEKPFRLAFNICLIVFVITALTSAFRVYVIQTTLPGDAYNPSMANLLVYFFTNVTQAMLIFSFMMMVSVKVAEQMKIKVEVQQKLFSIIAHDLSGPVGMINVMLNMANNDKDLQEKQRNQFYIEVEKLSSSTNHLLQNLLHWTRDQLGDLKPIIKKLDLDKVIVANIELLQQLAQVKGISIVYKPNENMFCLGDIRMVDTVVRNLISNAIKFSNTDGRITISIENSGTFVLVKVADNGVGMSKEVLKSLFVSGQGRTTSGTAGERGTGLGLMLAKEFVVGNKGDIAVKSTEGVGTEVVVKLLTA